MKSWINLSLLALLAGLNGCSGDGPQPSAENTPPPPADERPNILLIIADDLGYTDIGAFGSEIPTPHLDALAFEGVRLTNLHTGRACQQTRAMLMSGRGVSSVIQVNPPQASGERANLLRASVATLPELLRDGGYRTYMAGKWDLGLTDDTAPHARGFDRSFALLQASASHFAEPFRGGLHYMEDERRLELEDLPADFYSTRTYTDKMLEYLGSHQGEGPWFAYLAYTAPHWPLQVPTDWLDRHAGRYDAGYDALRAARFTRATELGVVAEGASLAAFQPTAAPWSSLSEEQRRRYARAQEIYAAMIELMDQNIGRLVSYLRDSGQLDDTVLVFMSDHGASASEFGMATYATADASAVGSQLYRYASEHDNRLENFGRQGSFVDHGAGFAEAATAPLKYFKGQLTEGGIRAAAFLRYPAVISEPGVNGTFMTVMDILPTFLQIAGTEHPGAATHNGREILPILGRSFWPHLAGTASAVHEPADTAGWAAGDIGAVIRGTFKLINAPPLGVVRSGVPPPWRLYDIAADPGETRDLAAEHPELVAELEREWESNWR